MFKKVHKHLNIRAPTLINLTDIFLFLIKRVNDVKETCHFSLEITVQVWLNVDQDIFT